MGEGSHLPETDDDPQAPPAELTGVDRDRWSRMPVAQRSLALSRMDAFARWRRGDLDVDAAAGKAGVSRSRFYRLAAEWRANPSLSTLGVMVDPGRRRSKLDPTAVNALQAVVPAIVRMNGGASVSQLVSLMVAEAGVTEGLPGVISLRAIVENELRRVAATGDAGHAVRFDCSAIGLPQAGGRPFVLFACLDAGTHLILGAAVSDGTAVAGGYAAAARDARARIDAISTRLHWADRLARIDLVAGVDLLASRALVASLEATGVSPNPNMASVPKRFGRYLRAAVGGRLGRVSITPARTEKGSAMPDNGDMTAWTLAEASAAVEKAVGDHNEALLVMAIVEPGGCEPKDLTRLLDILSEVT